MDGAALAVLDLDAGSCAATVEAITAAGGRAIAVGADVGQDDQVQAAVDKVATELGPPVVLVNNAGVLRDNLLFKMSDDDLRGRGLGPGARTSRRAVADRAPAVGDRRIPGGPNAG